MPAPIFSLIALLVLGVRGPRQPVLGTECAGTIERVGSRVTTFAPGDRVLAVTGATMGTHAQLVKVRATSAIVKVPSTITLEDAVAIPFGGLVALHALRNLARLRPGERVLVVGASGAIGVAAVQLARHMGAHVTGVCSTTNLQRVTDLGAHRVIDRTRVDFTQQRDTYDVVLDTVGATSFARCRRVLTPRPPGRFVAVLMGLTEFRQIAWTWLVSRVTDVQRIYGAIVSATAADLTLLLALAEEGHLRPVIDSTYPLERIVEAHRRVDTGRKVGSIVITVA